MGWDVWIKTSPPKSGRGQWIGAVIISGCFFTMGLSLAWPSSAFLKISKKEVNIQIDYYQMSLVAALGFLARLVSPIPSGYLMDMIGRKGSLMCGRLLQVTHWLLLYISHNVYVMYTARFIHGLFAGMVLFVCPLYISETTHKSVRGQALDFMSVMLLTGVVFESIVGPLCSYDHLLYMNFCVDFIMYMLMLMIPETPYFHLLKRNEKEAAVGLQWLRGTDLDVNRELDRMKKNDEERDMVRGGFKDIFRVKSNRKAFIISLSLQLIQRLSGIVAIIPFSTFIFPDPWWLPKEYGPIALNCTLLIMCAVSGHFVDSWGRKILLFISGCGVFVFMSGTALWFYFKYKTDYNIDHLDWLLVFFLISQGFFYSVGFNYIPSVVSSELFPMNIKAKASAIVIMISVSVSSALVFIFLPISYAYGIYVNFVIYATASFIGTIYSTKIIETKGKSLEAIQAELEGRFREPSDVISVKQIRT